MEYEVELTCHQPRFTREKSLAMMGTTKHSAGNRMSTRRLIAFIFLLTLGACGHSSPTAPGPSGPQTLYVSTTGNDGNAGSIGAPWQTLSYAVSQLNAGDTLYIRGGNYAGAANLIDSQRKRIRGGTSWNNPITIAGHPGEAVTLQPPDGDGIALRTPAQQYLIFQDLVIDGSLGSNYWVSELVYVSGGAHHNRFLRLEVKNGYVNGYQFSDDGGNSPFNEIVGGSTHDNGRSTGIGDGYGYGFYNHVSDTLVDGVDVYANAGYGIHSYTSGGNINNSRLTVRNCTIHGNGTNPNGVRGGSLYGLLIASGDSNVAQGNQIYGNRGGAQIYTGSTNAALSNNTIHDNIPLEGILIQFATGTVLSNNNVYGNGTDIVDLGSGTKF